MWVNVANASYSVRPMSFDFASGDRSHRKFTLYNTSKNTEFLQVELYRIYNKGTKEEKKEKIKPNEYKQYLLISPRKIKLLPKSKKKVRILNLRAGTPDSLQSDEYYQISVTPKLGEVKSKTKEGAISVKISLVTQYELPITMRARKPKAKLAYEYNYINSEIILTNKGNTLVNIKKVIHCVNNECEPETNLGYGRIYPGATKVLSKKDYYNGKLPLNISYNHALGADNLHIPLAASAIPSNNPLIDSPVKSSKQPVIDAAVN
jgi:P pilus assembly chaperone PapD